MFEFKDLTRVEQTLLLGFIPILGSTSVLGDAAAAAAIVVPSAFVVLIISRARVEGLGETARWAVLLAAGFGVAYALANVVGYVIPVTSAAGVYLLMTGATPLVFVGASRDAGTREFFGPLLRFLVVITAFGGIRELLGNGSLGGFDLFGIGSGPIGILSTSPGALMLFAGACLVSHIVGLSRTRKKEHVG